MYQPKAIKDMTAEENTKYKFSNKMQVLFMLLQIITYFIK